MDPCDTIRDCLESITLNINRVCEERAKISKQLEQTAEELNGAKQFLPPTTPSTVNKIMTKASEDFLKIKEGFSGTSKITNFSKFKSNVGPAPLMNLRVRGENPLGVGSGAAVRSSAAISRNDPVPAPVGGKWTEKMSKSQGKPYWTKTDGTTSWVKPMGAEITQVGGRRRTRRAKKSRSKSRKSRR